MTMNRRTKKLIRLAASVLTLCLFSLAPSALAQSTNSNCKQAKGNLVESFDPGIGAATGTLTNGGWLDGTTVAVFNSGAFPTPSPTQVTFGSLYTLTTNQGQLQGFATYLLDLVTGQGTVMIKIDPAASTGSFSGATGVLFLNLIQSDTVFFGPYHEQVGGQICFAN